MHGAGNDYVFVDGFTTALPESPSELAKRIANRHFGVGSDGLILMVPPTDATYDVEMQMWNADGSVGNMCGNGVRCVALRMKQHQPTSTVCRIKTRSRLVTATCLHSSSDGASGTFCVDMGQPEIVFTSKMLNNLKLPAHLTAINTELRFSHISMGNPHCVTFVQSHSDQQTNHVSPCVSQSEYFPQGTNVEWVEIISETELNVRVWERGSGETLACGSGACAAAVAAILQQRATKDSDITVNLPGGPLCVRWAANKNVYLTGPAAVSYTGILQNP